MNLFTKAKKFIDVGNKHMVTKGDREWRERTKALACDLCTYALLRGWEK